MNSEVSEIIDNIKLLPEEGKIEVIKILFEETLSDLDLEMINWAVDGIKEAKNVSTKLDTVISILDNAKERTQR